MQWEMWFTIALVILMMVGLIKEIARPDLILFSTLVILLVFNIIPVKEALSGFANPSMLTIALLFVVAGAIQKTGVFERFVYFLLGKTNRGRRSLLQLLFPISAMSAFMNNTPIVVTLTPFVRKWCDDHGVSPSKFLIPLSYATILGGMITLMGTSTNLIVHGLLKAEEGQQGFSFFELGIVGIPLAIVGVLYLGFIAYKILPNRKKEGDDFSNTREYLAEVIVKDQFVHQGKTVEQAGLRHLRGVFLVEIIRDNDKISPVKSTTRIHRGDRLIFTGDVQAIGDVQNTKGLHLVTETDLSVDHLINGNSHLIEAIVAHQSSLTGRKVKNTRFRSKFDAAIIAVNRNSERVQGKVGDIELKPGDTLLLLTGSDFQTRKDLFDDFYVVTPLSSPFLKEGDIKNGWISILSLIVMIALVAFNVLTMFKAMAIEVLLLLLLKIVRPSEAKRFIQADVLLLIASALGIGIALEKTGAAKWIATGLVGFGEPFGTIAILTIIYLLTNIFTEMITNNAAAAMMFPIAISTASSVGIDLTAMAVVVAISASAGFITPIGYQTNLIVYGPGNYKFSDYAKAGFPLSIISMIITITIVSIVWL